MKNILMVFIAIVLWHFPLYCQNPRIGGYTVYYGTLHNHSSFSADAKGDPEQAYIYARDSSKLDFFALSEHCVYLTQDEWNKEKQYADAQNRDSSFTALRGFEWTHAKLGHILILNTTGYSPSTNSATDTFTEIMQWISANNGVGFFNHPGRQNASGEEFSHFKDTPNLNIVGMELWNKTDGFATYYYNDGYYPNDGILSFFDEANTRRWKIGASGSEDNHVATWGKASNSRLAVLANANTRSDLLEALKKRHFYSTLDKNLALSFKLSNAQMGDSVNAGLLRVAIESFDGDNEYFSKVTLKINGITYKTWDVNTQHAMINDTITCAGGEYLYAVVSQTDGNEAISSPIYVAPYNPLIIKDSVKVRNIVVIKKIQLNLYTIIRSDTIINIDTIVQSKTIIMSDTVYNTDTLVVTDTTVANSSMDITDTIRYRDTLYFRDTLRIADTIEIADTLYVSNINTSLKQQDVNAYPNPFSNNISIRNSDKHLLTVIVYSTQGNVLIKQKSNEEEIVLETAHMKAGIYILSMLYADTSESFIIRKEE